MIVVISALENLVQIEQYKNNSQPLNTSKSQSYKSAKYLNSRVMHSKGLPKPIPWGSSGFLSACIPAKGRYNDDYCDSDVDDDDDNLAAWGDLVHVFPLSVER